MKNYERVIVTNHPATERSYSKSDKVIFMENATPHEVYTRAKEYIESGGRLIRPVLKDKTSYYATVGIFFPGDTPPTPWNLREIEAACRATEGLSHVIDSRRSHQLAEMRKNGPEHRKSMR